MKTLKNIIKRCEVYQKNNPKTEKLVKPGLQQCGKYPGEDLEIDFSHRPKANGFSCFGVRKTVKVTKDLVKDVRK